MEEAELSQKIAAAESRLCEKLAHLDLASSGISEYSQGYLMAKIRSAKRILIMYGRLLHLCTSRTGIPLEHFTLVDYGAGTGMLSFFAKEAGIGTVIYNDIYDVACADVKILSRIFGMPLDHIVNGDIDDLLVYNRTHSISANAIASHDVLEHIYNVESHFKKLRSLSDRPFRVVYASAANTENPRYVRRMMKTQIEAELKTRKREWGNKERDSLEAYIETRKRMISSSAPDLSRERVEQLSIWTRGLMKSDIEKCVEEYKRTGSINYRPDHPTNTCDPYTGNWTEHLINFPRLEHFLEENGYSAKILPGFYAVTGSFPKRSAKVMANAAIRLLGRQGMVLAPHYVVYANTISSKVRAPS